MSVIHGYGPNGAVTYDTGGGDAATPDDPYMDAIQQDPIYQQTVAGNAASLTAAGAQLGSQVANLVVQLGYVPDMKTIGQTLGLSPAVMDWLKTNVDWSTVGNLAQQANKNHTSLLSQLADQHAANQGSIKDLLAARGLYRSGGLSSDLGREAQRFQGANFNAFRSAAGSIGDLYGKYLDIKSGLDNSNNNALTDAYQRVQQMYPDGFPQQAAGAPAGPVTPGDPKSDPAAWQYVRLPQPGPFKAV